MFPAENVYVVRGAMTVGVPEIEQYTDEKTSPAGRLMADANAQDVVTVPPVQSMMIGSMGTFS